MRPVAPDLPQTIPKLAICAHHAGGGIPQANLRSSGVKSELRAPGSRLVLTLHPRLPCGQKEQPVAFFLRYLI